MKRWLGCILLLLPLIGWAAPSLPAFNIVPDAKGGQEVSVTLQVLAIMTALSFLPALLIMTTCFTRIIVVLSILRQAIGLQQTPSNQMLLGLSLFLTFFIMAPVFQQINEQALQPYLSDKMPPLDALNAAQKPLKEFMLHQTRLNDLQIFSEMAKVDNLQQPSDVPFVVLVPAFITSELKTAFQIGFLLFIPFLVIDLVVASILMTMGMMMLSPLVISLPFKIMLFVLVDGWVLIVGTLAQSFGG